MGKKSQRTTVRVIIMAHTPARHISGTRIYRKKLDGWYGRHGRTQGGCPLFHVGLRFIAKISSVKNDDAQEGLHIGVEYVLKSHLVFYP